MSVPKFCATKGKMQAIPVSVGYYMYIGTDLIICT